MKFRTFFYDPIDSNGQGSSRVFHPCTRVVFFTRDSKILRCKREGEDNAGGWGWGGGRGESDFKGIFNLVGRLS